MKIIEKVPNQINLAIGFITGRKNFKNLIKTYFDNWTLDNLINNEKINLNLIIVYDLKYHNTKESDYKEIDREILEKLNSVIFIGNNVISNEIKSLVKDGVIENKEAKLIFGDGYAKRRNMAIYFAIKNNMDYILFIDDDEYPLAVFNFNECSPNWIGQGVVSTHLKYIDQSHLTHGYHCGYISPIPYINFNKYLTEEDFRIFIEAISNDIINWDNIKSKMENGGITFADENIIFKDKPEEVKENNGCKFISGSNLCLNLKKAEDLVPFYNPPGARGEDTFLSTCLKNAKVIKVPCYTFHDGFLNYTHILNGVLPRSLKPVIARSQSITNRFINASIGWVRYKPLFLYITRRDVYKTEIKKMENNLKKIVPKLCSYFNTKKFIKMHHDLEYYHKNVQKHFYDFEETKEVWKKLLKYLKGGKALQLTSNFQ